MPLKLSCFAQLCYVGPAAEVHRKGSRALYVDPSL